MGSFLSITNGTMIFSYQAVCLLVCLEAVYSLKNQDFYILLICNASLCGLYTHTSSFNLQQNENKKLFNKINRCNIFANIKHIPCGVYIHIFYLFK